MSEQSSQGTPSKGRKTSPNSGKGPLKATVPISSVLKQNSNLRSCSSANVSPPFAWKNRTPDPPPFGQRSPGSLGYKCKPKRAPSECLRRTSSLDTIDKIYYRGHWPRDFYWLGGTLNIDKATQTDDIENEDTKEKLMIRPKIRSTKDSSSRHGSPGENTLNSSCQTLSAAVLSPIFKVNPVILPLKPLPRSSIRSSVEGLNQEIERIVLKTDSESHYSRNDVICQVTPEGHRAPLAELFRTGRSRSVNTQTPHEFESSPNTSASGDSRSPGSSPDQDANKLGSSPRINRFLAREPPDGCEKVQSKSLSDNMCIPVEHVPQPSTFKLKPSLGSAFQLLQPSNTPDEDLPLVPPRTEHN